MIHLMLKLSVGNKKVKHDAEVEEIFEKLAVNHPIMYDICDVCDYSQQGIGKCANILIFHSSQTTEDKL